ALDHRAPAAELDQALRRAVLGGEVALLVVAGPVTPLVHGGPEQPGRPERLVQWDHRRLPGDLVEQVEDGRRRVVRGDGTAGDGGGGGGEGGRPRVGPPLPAEVVGYAHGAGGVASHGVDAPVGGAGADGEDGGRLGSQPVEPFAGGHRLAGGRVVAETAPVAFGLDRLVRDGALHDQDKRLKLATVRLVPPLD